GPRSARGPRTDSRPVLRPRFGLVGVRPVERRVGARVAAGLAVVAVVRVRLALRVRVALRRRTAVSREPALVGIVGLAFAFVLVGVLQRAVEDGRREADLVGEPRLEGALEVVDDVREALAPLAAQLLVEPVRALE